jgi:hypothetical protein
MALTFAANGDLVAISAGAFTTVGATGTVLVWIYLTDDAARQYWFGHAAGGPEVSLDWRADQANDIINCYRQRSTTYLQAAAHAANFAAYGLNKWLCFAFIFNTGGADADQIMLMGDLSTSLAAPSGYSTQTLGSGTLTTTARDFYLGNGPATTRELHGRIGSAALFDSALTVAQCQWWQFNPRMMPGCSGLYHLGFNGTGTQTDYSGNGASGAVTGATQVDHVPVAPIFGARRGWRGAYTAPVAGGSVPLFYRQRQMQGMAA